MPVVRTVERTVTWLPNFRGWVDYHIFLPMVLRRRASRARAPLSEGRGLSPELFLSWRHSSWATTTEWSAAVTGSNCSRHVSMPQVICIYCEVAWSSLFFHDGRRLNELLNLWKIVRLERLNLAPMIIAKVLKGKFVYSNLTWVSVMIDRLNIFFSQRILRSRLIWRYLNRFNNCSAVDVFFKILVRDIKSL